MQMTRSFEAKKSKRALYHKRESDELRENFERKHDAQIMLKRNLALAQKELNELRDLKQRELDHSECTRKIQGTQQELAVSEQMRTFWMEH